MQLLQAARATGRALGGARVGVGPLLGVLLLSACQGDRPAEPRAEPPVVRGVRVVGVQVERVQEILEAVGTVRSRTQTVIASKVMGYVTEVRAREGDRVEAGQLLVSVEDRELTARVDRARAGLAEAESSLEESRRAQEEARAALEAAQAEHRYAEATAIRYRRLVSQELISVQDYDQAEARRASAAAAVEQARARIQSVQARETQARHRIDQARAELRTAELVRGDTRITSPAAGVVVERKAEPGNLAIPGQPLLVLDDPRQYRLEAVVGESAVGGVRVGQTVPVTLDSLARTVQGRVVEVIPAADPASRSVTVKVDLPAGLPLQSGAFGRSRFPVGERSAILVPVTALVERGQLMGVFVVDGAAVARLRFVTLGAAQGDRVEVLSGLTPGERIVTTGVGGVTDGSRVDAGG